MKFSLKEAKYSVLEKIGSCSMSYLNVFVERGNTTFNGSSTRETPYLSNIFV
jgi:hypothetical protein